MTWHRAPQPRPPKIQPRRCCGKRRFATREAAEQLIRHLELLSRGEKIPRRAYYHDRCGWWHLTSRPTWPPAEETP